MNIILAMTNDYGIGFKDSIPWHCSEELKLFKKITMNSVLIMGRKTAESIPNLPGRSIIFLSRSTDMSQGFSPSHRHYNKHYHRCNSITEALDLSKERYPDKEVFIAGGAQIYDIVLNDSKTYSIKKIYISIMKDHDILCDTFINFDMSLFTIIQQDDYKEFIHYQLVLNGPEIPYLHLIRDVLINGNNRVGRNGPTLSLFGKHILFDMQKGFPLLTTKKMFFRGIVEELLFFIRGETDTKLLEAKNINIWKGNTNRKFLDSIGKKDRKEGVMGPCYGYQWRHFNSPYDEKKSTYCSLLPGIDQLQKIITLIRTNPSSRRIVLTTWNPSQVDNGVLPPCHSVVIQFYINNEKLDMFAFSRSADLFLGLPFNIASYSLFLILIAKITNLIPGMLNIFIGDAHIYLSHTKAIETQLKRLPFVFPKVIIPDVKELSDIEKLSASDFILEKYTFYPSIRAKMIA